MYYICKPSKVQIYINTKYKTPQGNIRNAADVLSQIKQDTGCDIVLNGGLYDMTKWQPVCHLRANNIQYAADQYQYMGYGWDTSNLTFMSSNNEQTVRNYICCVALIQDGKPIQDLIYDSSLGGARGRTAIGTNSNGDIIVYCVKDGTSEVLTPEKLRDKLYQFGCKDALMLDGGGSSQCILPIGSITSTRIVENYICIWIQKENKCPYPEPTINIKLGSIGTGAKWVQWYLNANGANLKIDGAFGSASVKALKEFQTKVGITSDGVCGSVTRSILKQKAKIEESTPTPTPTTPSTNCPYTEPTSNISYGAKGESVKWLQWHLKECGYSIVIDGDFGSATKNILINFQKVNKLTTDGICGKQTREALKSLAGQEDVGGQSTYIQTLISKREQMLDYIEKRVGDIYVYGSQGQPAGDAIIDWSARCFPSYTTALRADRMKQYVQTHPTNKCGLPIKAHDCSGLFWAAENLIELPLVDGKDIDDSTAAGLYNIYCVPISKSELKPLDLVFNSDLTHVGIVGRNNKIYEAAGSDIGVVCNDDVDDRIVPSIYGPAYGCAAFYKKSLWTKFGRLKIYANEGL